MGEDGARVKDWLRARGHHLCLTDTIFQLGSHLAQLSETVWPISVEDYPKNILVKLFKNPSTRLEVTIFFFLFSSLATCLLNRAEPFDQF